MLSITPIPALETNYIWTITSPFSPNKAVIVDPGEAKPILNYLQQHSLELSAILITHHHPDHTGGVAEILKYHQCPVYAGAAEVKADATHRIKDGEKFTISPLNLEFTGLQLKGHTQGHTAFYGHNIVFTGDTLFAAGCGRNFEGSYSELYQSLQKLIKLPINTQIYCGHEYTEQNLRFGATVEPHNTDIRHKLKSVQILRNKHKCTLPSNFTEELKTNVFLRCHLAEVKASAQKHAGQLLIDEEAVFTVLRDWKNNF